MRVLVTGGTGFVGKYLLRTLARDHGVTRAEMFATTHPAVMHIEDRGDSEAHAEILPLELEKPDSVAEVVAAARPDVVFHLAGFPSAAGTDRPQIFATNVDGTRNLLLALSEAGRPVSALLASTGYVYGDTSPLGRPARETDFDPNRDAIPENIYAASKAEMERIAEPMAGENLRLTVTRAFNHTGAGQTDAFVVPAFARQIARIEAGLLEPVVKVGNLDAIRDFLDVRDVVAAYASLMTASGSGADSGPWRSEPWRVVNIASGTGVAIQKILETLVGMSGASLAIEPDAARQRPSDLAQSVGDPDRLHRLTGLKPRFTLTDTLRETLEHWRAKPS
jgi:GDP-4-dehydro-6-deoxy-D-mannose reductase